VYIAEVIYGKNIKYDKHKINCINIIIIIFNHSNVGFKES